MELEDAEYAVVAKWKMFKARAKLKDTIGGTVSQWLKKNRQPIPSEEAARLRKELENSTYTGEDGTPLSYYRFLERIAASLPKPKLETLYQKGSWHLWRECFSTGKFVERKGGMSQSMEEDPPLREEKKRTEEKEKQEEGKKEDSKPTDRNLTTWKLQNNAGGGACFLHSVCDAMRKLYGATQWDAENLRKAVIEYLRKLVREKTCHIADQTLEEYLLEPTNLPARLQEVYRKHIAKNGNQGQKPLLPAVTIEDVLTELAKRDTWLGEIECRVCSSILKHRIRLLGKRFWPTFIKPERAGEFMEIPKIKSSKVLENILQNVVIKKDPVTLTMLEEWTGDGVAARQIWNDKRWFEEHPDKRADHPDPSFTYADCCTEEIWGGFSDELGEDAPTISIWYNGSSHYMAASL